MPRRTRIHIDGLPLHIVQRGHNRAACFFDDQDRRAYLGWLHEALVREHCRLHAYVLMTNHVHLLLTPEEVERVPQVLISVGRRYVQYVNHTYGRTGTLWDGRYKSSLVQAETYLLFCHRYVELNPVRAGMVADPARYRWSSYRANALGEADTLVTPHERSGSGLTLNILRACSMVSCSFSRPRGKRWRGPSGWNLPARFIT